jgi:uncharacterized protein
MNSSNGASHFAINRYAGDMENDVALIALLMGLGAMLYSSVGHAGSSAYQAIMILMGVAATTMKPTALVLNIIVASLASFRFLRAGLFSFKLWLPFAVGALPFAYIGGGARLTEQHYKLMLAFVMIIAALRLLWPKEIIALRTVHMPHPAVAVAVGAGIGLLSGLTGTGGGIFLSPLILFFGWEEPRKASGVAALFILSNSMAGLLGNVKNIGQLPSELPWFVVAVLIGALVGTTMGISKLPTKRLLQALGLVMLVASSKLVIG